MKIDFEIIEQIEKQLNTINAAPFFLCISGSDNYGFSSENNSDVDIRGAYFFKDPKSMFCLPVERQLTREGEYFFEGMKYEWQIHEVLKFYRLMGKSNMNIFDWLFSDDWIVHPPEFFNIDIEKTRNISLNFINQNLIDHTFGWTKHMYNTDWRDPKKILHSLRPLMTCLYYLETGNYEPNIQKLVKQNMLNKYYDMIMNLIELKKNGAPTNDLLKQSSIKAFDELKEIIESKRDKVPNKSNNSDEINVIVTDIRFKTIKHYKFDENY